MARTALRIYSVESAPLVSDVVAELSAVAIDVPRDMLEHILRFTALPFDASAASSPYTLSSLLCATSARLPVDAYKAWLERFGDSDAAAARSAQALFTPRPAGRACLVPYFHSLLHASAASAAAALARQPNGTFLLRISSSSPGAFAFSYVSDASVKHTRVHRSPAGYVVDGRSQAFPTLPALVAELAHVCSTPLASVLSDLSATLAATESSYTSLPPTAPAPVATAAPVAVAPVAAAAPAPAKLVHASSGDSSARAHSSDVMLSYQWDEQPTVRRIRDALVSDGFSVWMDEQHMTATYVADMVRAVTRARCIVLATSSKYVASANCTTEASLVYEHARDKAYIVLNMEAGFYPARTDHVVAALAAGRLYVDFSAAKTSEELFAKSMAMLRKQLADAGITPSAAPAARAPLSHATSVSVPMSAPATVAGGNSTHVGAMAAPAVSTFAIGIAAPSAGAATQASAPVSHAYEAFDAQPSPASAYDSL